MFPEYTTLKEEKKDDSEVNCELFNLGITKQLGLN